MDQDLIKKLKQKKEQLMQMGGPDAVATQHKRGSLTVRERLHELFDVDSFFEIGLHADHCGAALALKGREIPADGVLTGWGRIDGRDVYCIAYDFTVLAGTMGRTGEAKCARIRDLACKNKRPIVYIIDSGGARVQEMGGSFFATTGYLFREIVELSGVVPQIAVIAGPGAAGTAYIPALCDLVVMVHRTSSLALGGPPLVKAVLGEEVSSEELGGADVHLSRSGVAHMAAKTDLQAMKMVRQYLSFFPSHCGDRPLRSDTRAARLQDSILDILPDDPATAFDMQQIIDLLVDGEESLAYMNDFGRSIITCFARVGGYPVGIVASQSNHLGGVLENDSAVKAARFISLCDAYQIPLIFLQDVPGFLVGSRVERAGIIRHGAKMLFAVSRATVPKITIIVRKAYGAGYYVMCGRAYEPDYIAAWPTGEIALMGAQGAVNILYGKKLATLSIEEAETRRKELEDEYRKQVSPEQAAAHFGIDDIIDPRDTALRIERVLDLTRDKHVPRLERRHGIFPV